MDSEYEMQVLLSAQTLNKALQRESLGQLVDHCSRQPVVIFIIFPIDFKWTLFVGFAFCLDLMLKQATRYVLSIRANGDMMPAVRGFLAISGVVPVVGL